MTSTELTRCRKAALETTGMSHSGAGEEASARKGTLDEAREWLSFLVRDESSSRNFFLQEYRLLDTSFYQGRCDALQPKRRQAWDAAWKQRLPWLDHPERLTVTELELALVIFDWQAARPRLAGWIRERPHILWRIHLLLLKRYCFELLGPLREAMRAHPRRLAGGAGAEEGSYPAPPSLDQPPFRAGEWLRMAPRIGGLTAIGFLACLGLNLVHLLCFVAPWPVTVALLALCLALLVVLYQIDVFKRNRGVLADLGHAAPRIWGATWRSMLWAGGLGLVLLGLWALLAARGMSTGAGLLPDNVALAWPLGLVDWRLTGRVGLGWLCLCSVASLLGCMVQWLWEDTSALEPI